MNRRKLLAAAGAAIGAGAAVGALAQQPEPPNQPGIGGIAPRRLDPAAGLSVILLGTGTPLPNPARACSATLVLAGERTFLVDTGRGCLNHLAAAGLQDVSTILFTHFHSDHYGEFGELMVNRTIWGADKPMPVLGPPGAKRVIGGMLEAYAIDAGFRKEHHKEKWSEAGMTAEIGEREPGIVYDQAGLKIEMFAVDHAPAIPAMGFRFDYKGKSVVISGDTKFVPWMAEKAKGCDLLIHDAYNPQMTQVTLAALRNNPRLAAMTREMMEYHTPVQDVARIGREARAKKLVLTHMVPSIPPTDAAERLFTRGLEEIYGAPVVVGRDGMELEA